MDKKRAITGVIVEHGEAAYPDGSGSPSYFVTLETPTGPKTLWGVDFGRAIRTGGVASGDNVQLVCHGRRNVTVVSEDKDENGAVIGVSEREVTRNMWEATRVSPAQGEQQQEQASAHTQASGGFTGLERPRMTRIGGGRGKAPKARMPPRVPYGHGADVGRTIKQFGSIFHQLAVKAVVHDIKLRRNLELHHEARKDAELGPLKYFRLADDSADGLLKTCKALRSAAATGQDTAYLHQRLKDGLSDFKDSINRLDTKVVKNSLQGEEVLERLGKRKAELEEEIGKFREAYINAEKASGLVNPFAQGLDLLKKGLVDNGLLDNLRHVLTVVADKFKGLLNAVAGKPAQGATASTVSGPQL